MVAGVSPSSLGLCAAVGAVRVADTDGFGQGSSQLRDSMPLAALDGAVGRRGGGRAIGGRGVDGARRAPCKCAAGRAAPTMRLWDWTTGTGTGIDGAGCTRTRTCAAAGRESGAGSCGGLDRA